jgi:ubiquitin C-terminal hydrolase
MTLMKSGNKGFVNLGNTCYMNSALQCLSHLVDFHPSNRKFRDECCKNPKGHLMKEWISLQEEMWSDTTSDPINPRNLLRAFQKGCSDEHYYFENFNQNDVDEFITLFMDLLHKSVCYPVSINIKGEEKTDIDKMITKSITTWKQFFKDNYSYIIQKFYSQLFSLTSCTECDYIATNFDPIMVLSLEIPRKASTMNDCLDHYTQKTRLDRNNEWTCEKCKNVVRPDKKIMLWNTSDILIILLKRYNGYSKNNQTIEYPLELDISSYNLNHSKDNPIYSLQGMCIHDGGLGGGHYYAICKNQLDDQWHIYNDSSVTNIKESEVSNYNPYCFFYKRT